MGHIKNHTAPLRAECIHLPRQVDSLHQDFIYFLL